jgi:tetratricopeptide (TPR) repeat protein
MRAMQRASVLDDPAQSFVGFLFAALGDFESAKVWHDAYVREYSDAAFGKSLELNLLLADGKTEDAARLAEKILRQSRDTIFEPELLRAIRDYNITVGLEGDSIERYREFYPMLFRDSPDVNRTNIMAAVDLVLMLKMTGQENAFLVLAKASLDLMKSMPRMAANGIFLLDVELYAILGDRDSAIESLRAANDAGLVFYLDSEQYYPNLAKIADDPEYQRLIGLIQDRVAEELRKIREMERAGRLARTPEDLPNIIFDLSL